MDEVTVRVDKVLRPRPAHFHSLINIDQTFLMLRADMVEQLAMAAREIGARYVRSIGVFDDVLRVYVKDKPWGPRLNWQNIDAIYDRLLAAGLRPYQAMSFTPDLLAASADKRIFTTRSNTSAPADYEKWAWLVGEFARHVVDRYGLEEVSKWFFEVWNEPNLEFFAGTMEEYWRLYEYAARAVKGVDARLAIGGPATARGEHIDDFLAAMAKGSGVFGGPVPVDFISTHIYNNDSEWSALSPFKGEQAEKQSQSADFCIRLMRIVSRQCRQAGFTGPLHWTEWGRMWNPYKPERETANEAAFILKTVGSFYAEPQLGDLFSYWNLSDIYDQVGFGDSAFQGNYGMLNLQGLKKTSYHAHEILARLAPNLIGVEGAGFDEAFGAFAAAEGRATVDVVLYNFQYERAEAVPPREVRLTVGPFEPSRARLRVIHRRIDEDHSNIVAHWRAMGSPDYPTPSQIEKLRAMNRLEGDVTTVEAEDGFAVLNFAQTPGSASWIRIEKAL